MAYLAAVLVDDSPIVADLVDELVADAEGYLEYGGETGLVKPSADPRGRAADLRTRSHALLRICRQRGGANSGGHSGPRPGAGRRRVLG